MQMIESRPAHKLPIADPSYRYPTSKNPYWTKLQEFKNLVYSDNAGEAHRGHWQDQFAAPAELHVEIGCNGGHTILEWAKARPHANFIGIDWKFKPIFRAAEKSREMELKNLRLLRGHAARIDSIFAPGELDALYLFFPDPWPKHSQNKNRFVTAEQLIKIKQVLKPGGIFHIKTDHEEYFDWMLRAYEETQNLWEVVELTRDLHLGHPNPRSLDFPQVTLFEKIFIRKGLPIYSLKLKTHTGGTA